MRILRCPIAVVVFCVCAAYQERGHAEDKKVEVVQSWTGILDEKKLTEVAPAKGYLTSQARWKKLWQTWRPGEKLPEVDFKKRLVLVNLSGMYPVGYEVRLSDEGGLKVQLSPRVPGKPGFGYGIAVIDRAGVKSIKGKAIEED